MHELICPIYNPKNKHHSGYARHLKYYIRTLRIAGCEVTKSSNLRIYSRSKYELIFDGHPILLDTFNFISTWNNIKRSKYHATFKSHTKYDGPTHDGIYPISPVLFYNWSLYNLHCNKIQYKARGPILNNQKPYAGAKIRRRKVQRMLRGEYGSSVDTTISDRLNYYKKVGSCLVSVFVPGARNNILDRGHLEHMALGACTIAPPLLANLPWGVSLVPGEHYIACSGKYNDLIEKIEWCKSNTQKCIEIGRAAKDAVMKSCSPQATLSWIAKCVEEQS